MKSPKLKTVKSLSIDETKLSEHTFNSVSEMGE